MEASRSDLGSPIVRLGSWMNRKREAVVENLVQNLDSPSIPLVNQEKRYHLTFTPEPISNTLDPLATGNQNISTKDTGGISKGTPNTEVLTPQTLDPIASNSTGTIVTCRNWEVTRNSVTSRSIDPDGSKHSDHAHYSLKQQVNTMLMNMSWQKRHTLINFQP